MLSRPAKYCMILIIGLSSPVNAAVSTYTDELDFQSALFNVTIANLEIAPLSADDLVPASDPEFLSLGIDVITPTSILGGQASQIPKPGRDRLILNGAGSIGANFAFNVTSPQHGVGALPNVFNGIGDGGHIRIYSGPNLTGNFLGQVNFGTPTGSFGGIISTDPFSSVEITCEFDADLRCGIYDLQIGSTPVPLPGGAMLMLSAVPFLRKRGIPTVTNITQRISLRFALKR
ncbi:MAG: hypothetical protein AAF387_14930 [Pseudomonadota bacterium]